MGDGILMAYRGSSEHVEIPDGVKQIGFSGMTTDFRPLSANASLPIVLIFSSN